MMQAYRVLRPGGLLGILQGLSSSAAPRHAGKRLLRLFASLASRGMGAPCAAATHGHAFTTEALTELVGRHFERCQSRSVGGRLFLTARKPAESEADA